MPKFHISDLPNNWRVRKIGVIGPGIVGMPMAALLAHSHLKIGSDDPARVVVVQRNSTNSGWKVSAINEGKSVIGGIEPGLNDIVEKSVAEGLLSATHDYSELSDADVVLVSVQTDKKGKEPDYGPLFGALDTLATALQDKPEDNIPLIIFESTLAPSSMATVIKDHFAKYGLMEGKDILLGNSPNRVMPGRLVHRVTHSDKLVAGLDPVTPQLIERLYKNIVTEGVLYPTNSMTAEVVKTLENAYRDVRIAYAAEVVRYCDQKDIDFFQLRDAVNEKTAQTDDASSDPNAVPKGGLLVPMIGVGGHCLPKDGVLLWWRGIEKNLPTGHSLILKSREVNDASPAESLAFAQQKLGAVAGKKVALLGAAYRFNSEDTRNSPTLSLAKLLQKKGAEVIIHDPYVKGDDQNLQAFELTENFTRDLKAAVSDADYIYFCSAHKDYLDQVDSILGMATQLKGIFDGCNLFPKNKFEGRVAHAGIGKGAQVPSEELVDRVTEGFREVEKGVANELTALIGFLNQEYAATGFQQVDFEEVQRLARSCGTGCEIVSPAPAGNYAGFNGFQSQLATLGKTTLA